MQHGMKKTSLSSIILAILIGTFLWSSCKKDIIVGDNQPPYYNEISTLLIENYVNRIFIDLIGREPLDSEMIAEVDFLRQADLATSAREALVVKLQTDTNYVFGDSSFTKAYYTRFYELAKARVLEGASDQDINEDVGQLQNQILRDSLNEDWAAYELHKRELKKLTDIFASEDQYASGAITIDTIFARMINNSIYDAINMNTFNFINASFDNLLYRYPTQFEFDKAFTIIEYNQSETLFGEPAGNKDEYVEVLIGTREFFEGCVIWAFQTLLARDPNSSETYNAMVDFYFTKDFQKVQKDIIVTDEYAGFD
jgi:hypothetical protein